MESEHFVQKRRFARMIVVLVFSFLMVLAVFWKIANTLDEKNPDKCEKRVIEVNRLTGDKLWFDMKNIIIKPDGDNFLVYDKNGVLRMSAFFSGKQNAIIKTYDTNGVVQCENTLSGNKDKEVRQICYFPSKEKNTQSAGEYKNGLRNGEFVEYYRNGKIRSIIHYIDGVRSGSARWFDLNGEIVRDIDYTNGEAKILKEKNPSLLGRNCKAPLNS